MCRGEATAVLAGCGFRGCGIPFAWFKAGFEEPSADDRARPRAFEPASKTTKRNFKGSAHMPIKLTRRQAIALPAGIAVGSLIGRSAMAAEPIKIGLVAALSGPSAKSGEGITRGLQI